MTGSYRSGTGGRRASSPRTFRLDEARAIARRHAEIVRDAEARALLERVEALAAR